MGEDKIKEENKEELLSNYEYLIKQLDDMLIEYILVKSIRNYNRINEKFFFVEPRELRPGARKSGLVDDMLKYHNSGLVTVFEDNVPKIQKGFIIEDMNKLIKANLEEENYTETLYLEKDFNAEYRYLGNNRFEDTLTTMIRTDYSLIIQKDQTRSGKYCITHYGVKVKLGDDDGAKLFSNEFDNLFESLSQARDRLMEFFGFKRKSGGRKSSSAIAAEYLRSRGINFTIYVGSCEQRALTKITPDKLSRYILLRLNEEQIESIEEENKDFRQNYIVENYKGTDLVVLRVDYERIAKEKYSLEKNLIKVGRKLIIPRRRLESEPKLDLNPIERRIT